MSNDTAAELRKLRKRGYLTQQCKRSGHWKILWAGELVAITSHTPGDVAAVRNLRAQVRRFERRTALL